MPPDPPAARAFGARNLPRRVLKSGYGPGTIITQGNEFRQSLASHADVLGERRGGVGGRRS